MKYHPILFLIISGALLSCNSLPDSSAAAEEFAWEISYQMKDKSDLVLAVADLDTASIPDNLYSLFRDDLSTALVTAFREDEVNIRVVTRDRVDSIIKEQALELEGMTYRDVQLQIGMLLGADLLVTGTLGWLEGDIYRFSGQIIDISTGTVAGGYSQDFWFDTESPD